MKNWNKLKSCLMAELHLRRQGYQILSHGYHCRYGQVDLVAAKDGSVHFIKVLDKSNDPLNDQRLTAQEREDLRRTGAFYISAHEMENSCRFDLVQQQDGGIEYLENAI